MSQLKVKHFDLILMVRFSRSSYQVIVVGLPYTMFVMPCNRPRPAFFCLQFAVSKTHEYWNTRNHYVVVCLVWVWNLVCYVEAGTYADGVRKWGADEDIWAHSRSSYQVIIVGLPYTMFVIPCNRPRSAFFCLQFVVSRTHEYWNTRNHYVAICVAWVWNLVSHIEAGICWRRSKIAC